MIELALQAWTFDILPRRAWIYLALVTSIAAGCKAYDATRLGMSEGVRAAGGGCGDGVVDANEYCDVAIPAYQSGTCPETCASDSPCEPSVRVGNDCQRRCVKRSITAPAAGDGCCPPGADATDDSDCAVCGDGVVSSGERCDPAAKGTCATPASCVSRNPCVAVMLEGNAESCSAHCVRREITACQAGDRCCPIGCDAAVDPDCSGSCGDGRWDAAAGETCDTNSTAMPCPTACDDGDPNTRDQLSGEIENCTAVCEHMPNSVRVDGDGICTPGSSSVDDSDCMPTCGNGIKETGEACDGDVLCDASCRAMTPEEATCMQQFAESKLRSDACKACICQRCTIEMLECFVSAYAERNQLCGAVIECARQNQCRGQECVCKGACSMADGACIDIIAEATGDTRDLEVIRRRAAGEEAFWSDSNYASYYALTYDTCTVDKCAAECAANPIPR